LSWILILEQSLNWPAVRLMLFLLAAGLTAGVRHHGHDHRGARSLYMLGAFIASTLVQAIRLVRRRRAPRHPGDGDSRISPGDLS